MKKVIVGFTVFVILFNFIFANNAYAAGVEGGQTQETKIQDEYMGNQSQPENDAVEQILEGGKADDGTGNKKTTSMASYGPSIIGTVLAILAGALNLLIFQVDLIMSQLTYSNEIEGGDNKLQYFFSIERTVFNRVPLFNIDFFDTEETYKVGDTEITSSESVNEIKESVAKMFYILRVIATAAALVVLVYIGIRMSISTLSDDKAKYKKMLVGWVESIAVLFLLEYVIAALIMLGEFFVEMFYKMELGILENSADKESFESTIRFQLLEDLFSTSGMQFALNSLMYWCLLFMQAKYFWTYMKRVLMVGFLIMIAPLITVTYAIDKAGDGKAQAFAMWLKEFGVNVLIQPLHALIYLVFMFSAGEIAKISPIVAIALLMCMGAVERMVKVIFNLKGLVSLRGIDKLGKKQ